MRVEPFEIAVADEALADLRERIRRTRWPDEIEGIGWEQGTPLDYLRSLLTEWADGFDWRAREAELNRLPQFRAEVGGQWIHFVHVRAAQRPAIPLVLTHGWPSTFLEMLPLVPLLTDPRAHGIDGPAFDVVIPSLPGYGFSDRPRRTGMSTRAIGTALGRADARARLFALRGRRHRLRRRRRDLHGARPPGAAHRHPPDVPGRAAVHRARLPPAVGCRARVPDGERPLDAERVRLRRPARDQAADRGLRLERLARRAGRLDRGEVALVGRHRRRRRRALRPRAPALHAHDLLGERDDRLLDAPVLGEPPIGPRVRSRRRRRGPDRIRRLRERARARGEAAARVGRARLRRAALDGDAARRALPGRRGAASCSRATSLPSSAS